VRRETEGSLERLQDFSWRYLNAEHLREISVLRAA
jgi:hypothetical protein